MSKIGKMPIEIPAGVTVTVSGNQVAVAGTKGNVTHVVPAGIIVKVEENKVVVSQVEKTQEQTKALFGLTRALLNNIIKGLSVGFEKRLEMTGVGYRAQAAGQDLTLNVGYSHPVKIKAPAGVMFAMEGNVIVVSGSDKALVGDLAAKIRAVRPPEPYKGKGIKYVGEYIRRKAGKAAKAVGGAK
ncbi:MAG TPA: 50S ribosomal protein L6 [Patescibacteria group bacterium]|nr:50S ribosomal protein L6 [Patescibacteria group bacterium]